MRDKFHAGINTTRYNILFDHELTKLFSIENFCGAKHAGKVLIIIIILFLISIIIIIIGGTGGVLLKGVLRFKNGSAYYRFCARK